MKKSLLALFFFTGAASFAQQNYTDDKRFRRFGPRNGVLDSASVNPSKTELSRDESVIKYDRSNSVTYDNIKIYPTRRLADVSAYATHTGNPPKIKMKVYSNAPPGTRVEIQLGKKGDDSYPGGVHSQYQALTTTRNQWEELTFQFTEIPQGSHVAPTDIDKITLLFDPNSNSSYTFYFDDLIAPPMAPDNTVSKQEQPQSPNKK
jgi:hypothetical protein